MPVREARPADRPAIERLQQRLPESAPDLLSGVAGGELLVSVADGDGAGDEVESDGQVVGYLLWFPGGPVYAAELVVHPDYREEGRGSQLFRAVFDRLEDGATVDLRVAAENEGAIRLYRRLGFECVECIPDAYESGAGYRMRYVVGENSE